MTRQDLLDEQAEIQELAALDDPDPRRFVAGGRAGEKRAILKGQLAAVREALEWPRAEPRQPDVTDLERLAAATLTEDGQ
jgi:hypothetical protein